MRLVLLYRRLLAVRSGTVVSVDRRLPSHVQRFLFVPATVCHISYVVCAAVRRPRVTRRRTAECSDARARLRHWQVTVLSTHTFLQLV